MHNTVPHRFAVLAAVLLLAPLAGVRATESERPIVGAWRWDAWYGEGEPTRTPEASLGPPKYHFRLPWFARIVGEDKVEINGDSQEIIEQEIAYAKEAGLDYWGFLEFWDQEDPDYKIALQRYQAAKNKHGLRYCMISEGFRLDRIGADKVATEAWPRLIEHFKSPDYQTVLDGRPLFFLCRIPKQVGRREFQQLGDAAVAAGLKRPYLVTIEKEKVPGEGWKIIEALGIDAICADRTGPYTFEQPSYAKLIEGLRNEGWERYRALRIPSVTFAISGWDTRPRNEHRPAWAGDWCPPAPPDPTPPSRQKPLIDAVTATPDELAAHIRDAVAWTRRNRDANPSNTILIYGWNENDEGGWLIPTLGADGRPNEERIKALAKVLRAR